MAIQKNYFNNIVFPALLTPEEAIRNHFFGKEDLLSSSFASDFFRTDLLREYKLSTKYVSGDDEIRLKFCFMHPVLFVPGWLSWPRETPGQATSRIRLNLAIAERFVYSQDILKEMERKSFNPRLIEEIKNVLQKDVARASLYLLRRGKLNSIRQMFNKTSFNWSKVVKYFNYRPSYADPLAEYSPASPYKRELMVKENY
jgi:hypothetical protein